MRAILIDPFEKTVEEIEYDGDFRTIYELISAHIFSCVDINEHGDSIYIDDEGLFKTDQEFFVHENYEQPLAGKGLVLGVNREGESIEPTATADEIRAAVLFPVLAEPPEPTYNIVEW